MLKQCFLKTPPATKFNGSSQRGAEWQSGMITLSDLKLMATEENKTSLLTQEVIESE